MSSIKSLLGKALLSMMIAAVALGAGWMLVLAGEDGGDAPLSASASVAVPAAHAASATEPSERANPAPRARPATPDANADTPKGPASHRLADLPAGSTLEYAFRGASRYQLTHTRTQRSGGFSLAMTGRLQLLVVDHRDGETVLAARFPQLNVNVRGSDARAERLKEMGSALARHCLVRLDAEGRLAGFRFEPSLDEDHCNWMRSLIAAFQFVVPDRKAEKWHTTESDTSGSYRAAYQQEAGDAGRVVRKQKIAYEAGEGAVAPKVESHAEARFDRRNPWITAVSLRETFRVEAEHMPIKALNQMELDYQLERAERGEAPVTTAKLWSGGWESVAGSVSAARMAQDREARLRERVGGRSTAELVRNLQHVLRTEPKNHDKHLEAVKDLSAKVNLDDEATDEIDCALREPGTDERFADALLTAVGAANAPHAQSYLAELVNDSTRPQTLRSSAVESLIQVRDPGADTFAAMRKLIDDPNTPEEIRSKGMLVQGALASRQDANERHSSGYGFADLLAYERSAKANGTLTTWLAALGNSGHPEVVNPARRYMDDRDMRVRHAAVTAIRRVNTLTATLAIRRVALNDRNETVRAHAASILAARSDATALAAVGQVLGRDRSENVRRGAIAGLAQQADNPAARRLLFNAASADASWRIRELARRILNQPAHA